MAWREALCALMTFLHLAAPCAATAEARSECHVPEQVQNTQPFPHEMFPSREGTSLRYKCKVGYKRKAGTSNLIMCKADAGESTARWTRPEVECIRDPSLPPPPATFTTKRTTSSTAPEAHSTTYQDQFWNKHTRIGGGVTAALVFIVLSGIAIFMTWKKRNQQHTPKTSTEDSSIPMMSHGATKERADSNLIEEQNTEHVEEGA